MTGIVAHTYPEWWLKLAGQVAHWSTDYSDGKMILFLLDENSYDCNIDIVNESFVTDSFLDIKSGNVLVVSAGELIQCAAYKELDMETILELSNIKKGKYAIKKNDISNIVLSSVNTTPTSVHNIVCF